MHLVAVRAQNDEVLDRVVLSVSVEMGDLEYFRHAEAAVRTDRRVVVKRQFPIVHASGHGTPIQPNIRLTCEGPQGPNQVEAVVRLTLFYFKSLISIISVFIPYSFSIFL